jgi:gluconate kinase
VSGSRVQLLLITGPVGAGKSTVGWEVSAQLRRAGCRHVVLDSDELDRVWPLSPAERKSLNCANLAAFWSNASALGHDRLVLIGVFLNAQDYRKWIDDAVPNASITRIVLQASDQELERRVRAREIGSECVHQLRHSLQQACVFRDRNDGSPDVLDTNDVSVAELARFVIQRTGWTQMETAP